MHIIYRCDLGLYETSWRAICGPASHLGYQSLRLLEVNPLNAELNPICHLLPLLGGATIVVVSRLKVNYVFISFTNVFLREAISSLKFTLSDDRLVIE
jgi:hypothetical protein